jgi:predicted amidophosphoribosyltransferase
MMASGWRGRGTRRWRATCRYRAIQPISDRLRPRPARFREFDTFDDGIRLARARYEAMEGDLALLEHEDDESGSKRIYRERIDELQVSVHHHRRHHHRHRIIIIITTTTTTTTTTIIIIIIIIITALNILRRCWWRASRR